MFWVSQNNSAFSLKENDFSFSETFPSFAKDKFFPLYFLAPLSNIVLGSFVPCNLFKKTFTFGHCPTNMGQVPVKVLSLYLKSALSPLLIWSSGLFGNPVKALTVWPEPNQMQLAGSGTQNYHTITGKLSCFLLKNF